MNVIQRIFSKTQKQKIQQSIIINLMNKTKSCTFSVKMNLKTPYVDQEIKKFSKTTPIEEALTPPSSWYLSKEFYEYEMEKVFKKNWVGLFSNHQLKKSGDFITGELINQPFLFVKNDKEEIKCFYNVCSHHASTIKEGSGSCKELVCPYHGWTYNYDGALTKCTSMKGIKNFKMKENGLKPIKSQNIGNILFLNFNNSPNFDFDEQFFNLTKPFKKALRENNFKDDFSELAFVKSADYLMKCNWKVFIDNYCDGGYHIPFAHKDLGSNLDLSTYKMEIYEKCSLQIVKSDKNDKRIGNSAVYCYIYPNILFNRYGPWLDINVVIPLNEKECIVKIEWFVDKEYLENKTFIQECLTKSEKVQNEDVYLCENVMKGIKSDAYDKGRYIPSKEAPAYQFHMDLLGDLDE